MVLLDQILQKINSIWSKCLRIIQKKNSLLYFEGFHKKCEIFTGDINDDKFIKKIVKKINFKFYFISLHKLKLVLQIKIHLEHGKVT